MTSSYPKRGTPSGKILIMGTPKKGPLVLGNPLSFFEFYWRETVPSVCPVSLGQSEVYVGLTLIMLAHYAHGRIPEASISFP